MKNMNGAEMHGVVVSDDAKKHFELYQNYVNDNTFETNSDKAMEHLEIAAESGYPTAQAVLGNRILDMNKNIDEGRRWLETAFENGYVDVVFPLYDSYYCGEWTKSATEIVKHPIDKAKAVEFLKKAVDIYERDGKSVPIIYYYLYEYYDDEINNENLSVNRQKSAIENALYYCRKAKDTASLSNGSHWILEEIGSIDESLEELLATYSNTRKTKGPCYVATAVYGSYDCPEVWTLRRFRDEVLYRTFLGKTFIKVYYRISPSLVKKYGDCKPVKKVVRAILNRFIKKLNAKGISDSYYVDR